MAQKYKQLYKFPEEEVFGRTEFLEAFKKVMELILAKEKRLEQALMEMRNAFSSLKSKLESDSTETKTKLERISQSEQDSILRRFSAEVSKINSKLSEVKDGKDADEEMILNKIMEMIKLPTVDDFLKAIPEKEEKTLTPDMINGLEDYVKKYVPSKPFGGSVVHKFMDDDTPSGTVNGVNTDFVLAKSPLGLKVFVNGQKMTLTEDYTISNKTITFNTAPPTGSIIRCDYRYY